MARKIKDEFDANGVMTRSTFLLDDDGNLLKSKPHFKHDTEQSFYEAFSDHLELGDGHITYGLSWPSKSEPRRYNIGFNDCDLWISSLSSDYVLSEDIAKAVCTRLNADRCRESRLEANHFTMTDTFVSDKCLGHRRASV